MARDFKVSMTLEAKDDASSQVARTLKETTGQAEKAAKAIKRQGYEQQKTAIDAAAAAKQQAAAATQAAKQSIAASRSQMENARRLMRAREALGVRSEQSIQREIARTIASYNRLTRAGTLSAREQARAYHQMRQQVAGLRQELKGVTTLQQARGALTKAGVIAGGAAAFGAAFVNPVRNRMTYDERLTEMANTAFSDDGMKGRQVGMQRLDKMIRDNAMSSGLNKESVMDTANTLLASGLKEDAVSKLLPTITRYASAAKADPNELADIAVKARSTFGITDEQMPTMLNMAIAAGQSGNFELKDMAKWLGQQMAFAKKAGMSGLGDFGKLLTLNELSSVTAGNSDQAGNNVVNLLGKLTSQDAANAAANIKIKGKGIDLPGTLAESRKHGTDPIEAFSRVIDEVVGSNKKYQVLQARLKSLPKDDKNGIKETLESMSAILEGTGVGKVLADQQALMAMIAYRNGQGYKDEIERDINKQRNLKPGEQGAGDLNFEFNQEQGWFKAQQFNNTKEFAELDAAKKLADATGTAAGKAAELAVKFPALASAVSGATTAIQGMTQAAIAFAGIKLLTGGIKAASGAGAVSAGAAAGGKVVASSGGLLGIFGKIAGPAMAVTTAATFTTSEEDEEIINGPAKWRELEEKYGQATIDKARKKYQPWYQFGRGYAAENEQWIKQLLAENGQAGALPSPQQVIAATQPPQAKGGTSQTTASPTPTAAAPQVIRLEVDGRTLAEIVNQINAQEGVRG
ncbi:phage tail tape measure protein [Edwardsiella piscicida]|nr:phage tail tape measure protein [Edwardsiella piscicida]